MEPCPYIEDLKEMKRDIKTLLKFKWQMSGGWVLLTVVCSVFFSFASLAVVVFNAITGARQP